MTMGAKKTILVVAKYNQAEALRVAAGLTLLNDTVRVAVLGRLASDPAVQEQKDVLDFAEVACEEVNLEAPGAAERVARALLGSDVTYLL